LRSIYVNKRGYLDFIDCDWTSYWQGCDLFDKNATALDHLHSNWRLYIESGFHLEFAKNYCASFFSLLQVAIENSDIDAIARLLNFESFKVLNESDPIPYIAMTTNFRHPLFVLLTARGVRRDDKLDSRHLPILTLSFEDKVHQYYCLTKDKLGRGNNHNLLVFLNTGPQDRSICFNALQPLVGILHDEWGEFVNMRAARISKKVILPLLEKCPHILEDNLLKVLDVGSGVGMVLSNVIASMATSSDSMPKIQACLLDRIAMDPKVQFYSNQVMRHVSSIDYIKCDYKVWFDEFTEPYEESYNITFIYRLLHTMSEFRVLPETNLINTEYTVPEYSDYFKAAHILCGGQLTDTKAVFNPKRIFNLSSLETVSGKSIIEKCARMSTWTIIEDLDLDPQSLTTHLKRHKLFENIFVINLLRALRLRTNYIYCICSSRAHLPDIGDLIWPG